MTDHIHITTPTSLSDDVVIEPTLRPHQLDEFIGQNKVRDLSLIHISEPTRPY